MVPKIVSSNTSSGVGRCLAREDVPKVAAHVARAGIWLEVFCYVSSVVLILSTGCACISQYQKIPPRIRRYQTRWESLGQMLCPCVEACEPRRKKKKAKRREPVHYDDS